MAKMSMNLAPTRSVFGTCGREERAWMEQGRGPRGVAKGQKPEGQPSG